VRVAPSGRFVYGSNRGHDSIVIFAVDPENGTLSQAGHVATQGANPRNFTIDPSGRFLLAANQDSDTVVTFRIDAASGELTATGHVTNVPSPVCVTLVPARRE
jgi:6-phosphogluconolactonase